MKTLLPLAGGIRTLLNPLSFVTRESSACDLVLFYGGVL